MKKVSIFYNPYAVIMVSFYGIYGIFVGIRKYPESLKRHLV